MLLYEGQYLVMEGGPLLQETDATLLMQLRDLKALYRQRYEALRDVKAEVNYCQHLVDQCRVHMLSGQLSKYIIILLIPSQCIVFIAETCYLKSSEIICISCVPEFENWYKKAVWAPEEELDIAMEKTLREVRLPHIYNSASLM